MDAAGARALKERIGGYTDPFHEGWKRGMTQAVIEIEAAAGQADLGGEWGDPGEELRQLANTVRAARDA